MPRRRTRSAGQFADRATDLRGELPARSGGHQPADERDDHEDEAQVLQRGLPAVAAELHHPGEAEQPLLGPLLQTATEPLAAPRPAQQHDDGHRYHQPRDTSRPGPAAQLREGAEDDPRLNGEEPVPDPDTALTDEQRQHEGADAGQRRVEQQPEEVPVDRVHRGRRRQGPDRAHQGGHEENVKEDQHRLQRPGHQPPRTRYGSAYIDADRNRASSYAGQEQSPTS